jgi:hypothetical protein
MRQQEKVDRGRFKAEWLRILFRKFTPALVQTTVNQDIFPRAMDQVARPRHILIGAVK